MTYQMTFKRYELKYMINRQQKENMLQSMEAYMKLDQYKRTTIRNIYFDTETYRLARHFTGKTDLQRKASGEKLLSGK